MTLPVPDKQATLNDVRDASARWTALLRGASNPSATAIGHWTVRDLAAHTSHIFAIYPGLLRGDAPPIDDLLSIGDTWNRMVAEESENDMDALAKRIDVSTEEFLELVEAMPWEEHRTWYGDVQLPIYSLAALLVNECTIHGLDVARAESRRWEFARDRAVRIVEGHLPILPYFVDPVKAGDLQALYELRLRGGPTVYLSVVAGALTIALERPGSIDCRISADPASYLLVGYGREHQLKPVLTGKIVAWGRKPWLGLKLASIFRPV